jgi:hypothetical protein
VEEKVQRHDRRSSIQLVPLKRIFAESTRVLSVVGSIFVTRLRKLPSLRGKSPFQSEIEDVSKKHLLFRYDFKVRIFLVVAFIVIFFYDWVSGAFLAFEKVRILLKGML